MKKAVEQGTVIEEIFPEIFIYGKNTVTVGNIHQFKRHTGSAFHGIFVPVCRAEPAMAAKRNKFKFATGRTAIYGTAKRGITTVDHLIDVLHFGISRMESVFNFFIIVSKNLL